MSSKKIILKRKPVVATPDMVAPDNRPTTLPPKTLQLMKEALEKGEYLEEVDCYWNPKEADDFQHLKKLCLSVGEFRDYRKRPECISVSQLKGREEKLVAVREGISVKQKIVDTASDALTDYERKNNIYYTRCYSRSTPLHQQQGRLEWTEEYKELIEKFRIPAIDLQRLKDERSNLEYYIQHTKNWKPQRRITFTFTYYDQQKEDVLKRIEKEKEVNPILATKLGDVVRMRGELMSEMNKSRGNPMRNVYLVFNLTPMDYRIQASWNIRRNEHNDWSGEYITHQNHITEYNLMSEKVEEYRSAEMLLDELEKQKLQNDKELLKKRKTTPYKDLYSLSKYKLNEATRKEIKSEDNRGEYINPYNTEKLVSILQDEDVEDGKYRWNSYSFPEMIVSNTNFEENTFEIVGYYSKDDKIRKAKNIIKVEYKKPRKNTKTTQMQKDLKVVYQNKEMDTIYPIVV
jgi:hypothetical protein